MATGYYTLTGAADPQTVCEDFEGEADVSACVARGSQGEAVASTNQIVFVVTGVTAGDITDAATAIGGVEVARGYPVPA